MTNILQERGCTKEHNDHCGKHVNVKQSQCRLGLAVSLRITWHQAYNILLVCLMKPVTGKMLHSVVKGSDLAGVLNCLKEYLNYATAFTQADPACGIAQSSKGWYTRLVALPPRAM